MLVERRQWQHPIQNPNNKERNLHQHPVLKKAKNLTTARIPPPRLPTNRQLKYSPKSPKSRLHTSMASVQNLQRLQDILGTMSSRVQRSRSGHHLPLVMKALCHQHRSISLARKATTTMSTNMRETSHANCHHISQLRLYEKYQCSHCRRNIRGISKVCSLPLAVHDLLTTGFVGVRLMICTCIENTHRTATKILKLLRKFATCQRSCSGFPFHLSLDHFTFER